MKCWYNSKVTQGMIGLGFLALLSAIFVLDCEAKNPIIPELAQDSSKPDNTPPKGFKSLFNGKDLTGWQAIIAPPARAKLKPEQITKLQKQYNDETLIHWPVKDGMIYHDSKGGKYGANLGTDKDYGNFELYVDWKIEERGDSGLYLRGTPQVQIWDSDHLNASLKEDWGTGSGGLWNN